MNAEEKKAKRVHKVELEVNLNVERTILETLAINAQRVAWQSQIRNHWDEFLEGKYPKSVDLGQTLFTTTRVKATPLTVEAATEKLRESMASMTMEEKMEKLKEMGLI